MKQTCTRNCTKFCPVPTLSFVASAYSLLSRPRRSTTRSHHVPLHAAYWRRPSCANMHSLVHRANTVLTFFGTVAATLAILTACTGETELSLRFSGTSDPAEREVSSCLHAEPCWLVCPHHAADLFHVSKPPVSISLTEVKRLYPYQANRDQVQSMNVGAQLSRFGCVHLTL